MNVFVLYYCLLELVIAYGNKLSDFVFDIFCNKVMGKAIELQDLNQDLNKCVQLLCVWYAP